MRIYLHNGEFPNPREDTPLRKLMAGKRRMKDSMLLQIGWRKLPDGRYRCPRGQHLPFDLYVAVLLEELGGGIPCPGGPLRFRDFLLQRRPEKFRGKFIVNFKS